MSTNFFAGNGPSALTLSYLLNGNWPYYNGHHPDDIIHARLDFDKTKSILEAVSSITPLFQYKYFMLV